MLMLSVYVRGRDSLVPEVVAAAVEVVLLGSTA
jgi:hypothetical protein